jgi:hypothetical protein
MRWVERTDLRTLIASTTRVQGWSCPTLGGLPEPRAVIDIAATDQHHPKGTAMFFSRRITAAAAVITASLAAAPAALAHPPATVGNVTGAPVQNVCLFEVDCTYVNFAHGKPVDVVRHSGTITSWSALQCGGLQLRVLRPAGNGKFRFVRSSIVRAAPNPGINVFPAHIPVKAGDVLALRDTGSPAQSSCIMFAKAGSSRGVRYYKPSPSDGSTRKPNACTITDGMSGQGDAATPHLRVLFSATVQ